MQFYPEQAKKLNQSDDIVAELQRRQKKGTFGKEPPEKWPSGFDAWTIPNKLDFLIDELDEVDARRWAQPGGVPLGMDRRFEALIQLGEAAVPKLIDTVEHDDRPRCQNEIDRPGVKVNADSLIGSKSPCRAAVACRRWSLH